MSAGKSTEICRAAKAAHVKPNGRSVEEEVGVKERINCQFLQVVKPQTQNGRHTREVDDIILYIVISHLSYIQLQFFSFKIQVKK